MRSIRSLLGCLILISLAAISSVASADNKNIVLSVSPTASFFGGGPILVTATVTNNSPGNSSFDSLQLAVAGGLTISSVTISPPSNPPATTDGTTVFVPNLPPVRPNESIVLTMTIADLGCPNSVSASWTVTAWTGTNFSGDTFAANGASSVVRCDDTMACGETLDETVLSNVAPDQPGHVAGFRSLLNDNSGSCASVGYDATNDILSTNNFNVLWDRVKQPHAVLMYTLNWAAIPASTKNKNAVAQVAWELNPDGTPKFTDGLACLKVGSQVLLPAPYGTLLASVSATATSLSVSTTASLPSAPFPIVVSTNDVNERMQVTRVTKNATNVYTLTVARGTGGTVAASHQMGDIVNSTPLPIDTRATSPYKDKQVQVCVVDHQSQQVTDSTGAKVLLFFTTVLDDGDGYVRLGGF